MRMFFLYFWVVTFIKGFISLAAFGVAEGTTEGDTVNINCEEDAGVNV